MNCKICGKREAAVLYDRIADRFFVHCAACGANTTYTQLRTKAEVIAAYDGQLEAREKAATQEEAEIPETATEPAPEDIPQEIAPKRKRGRPAKEAEP